MAIQNYLGDRITKYGLTMVRLMPGDVPKRKTDMLLDAIQQAQIHQNFKEIPNHRILCMIDRVINATLPLPAEPMKQQKVGKIGRVRKQVEE